VMPKSALAGYTAMAHNDYLQILAEVGPAALASWLAALLLFAQAVRRGLATEENPVRRTLALSLASGVLSFAVHGLVDYDFYVQATGLAAFLSMGLCAGLLARPGATQQAADLAAASHSASPASLPGRPRASRPQYRWQRRSFRLGGPEILGPAAVLVFVFSALAGPAQMLADQAERLVQARKIPQAKATLQRATGLMPLNGQLWVQRSEFLLAYGERFQDSDSLHQAEDCARRAVSLQPYFARNRRWLGDLLVRRNRLEEAAATYDQALRLNPHYLEALVRLASVRLRLGQVTEGKTALQRVLEIERGLYGRIRAVPDLVELSYAHAHLYLGALALNQGAFAQAAENARRAENIAAAALASPVNNALALTFAPSGQDRRLLSRAVALALLSEAEKGQGQSEAAKQHLEEALSLAPDSALLLAKLRKEWVLE